MANIYNFKKEDYQQKKLDFDLQKVYDIPAYEQMIFFFVNFDKCRKEIMRYEEKRKSISPAMKHPIHSKKEALDLLRCHSKHLFFEPICLELFNDARECLFRMDGVMRICQNELHLFEECIHDPQSYYKFQQMGTKVQNVPKKWFAHFLDRNYLI